MMILIRRNIAILALLSVTLMAGAQFYDTGTDPASLRWQQLKTGSYRIIFPAGHERQAQLTANYLESSNSLLEGVYKLPERRFTTDVVLHPYSSESNGYVGYAPRRMELFPMPEQNSLPADNLRLLALHEAVHVMQFMSLQNGFTGIISRIGGQQMTGIVAALSPFWFYEGDAVLYETLLTPSGRGTSPSFNMNLKALYTSVPGGYSYNKMLLGSYRDYTPDHYRYGYRILEYSRAKYGDNLWRNSLEFTASKPYLLNPLNIYLKKNTSLSKRQLFDETFSEFSNLWQKELESEASLQYRAISPIKRGDYINYHSPVFFGADTIAAIKSSFSTPPSIVLLSKEGGYERTVAYTGYMPDPFISAAAGKIVWSQFEPDHRWENRNFLSVYIYDAASGIARRLTSGSRYASPALSPDGRLIAVAENSVTNDNYLVILNPENGNVVSRIATPENAFPQRPQWSEGNSSLSVILLTNSGEGVFTYSIDEDRWSSILEPSYNDLQMAVSRNDTLFFISSAGGTDNLFLRSPDGTISRVSKSRYGVGSFSLRADSIVLSDYGHDGFTPVITTLASSRFDYYNPPVPSASFISRNETYKTTLSSDTAITVYETTPYRKWKNIFNIHSWMPLWIDLDEIDTNPSAVSPGVTLFSQNLLSTLITTAGYEYSGGRHRLHAGLTWKGWYPVVSFRAGYGGDPQIIRGTGNTVNPSVVNPDLSLRTEVYIPLTFSRGAYTRYLRPSFTHRYNNRYIYQQELEMFDYGQTFMTGSVYFSNSRRSSYRSIFPLFAQAIEISHTAAPFDTDLYGPISSIRTSFYFPGLMKDHGLRLRLQAEVQKPAKFIQFNRISFPRGYTDIIAERLETASADYVFPIAYPDLSAGSLFYLKRIRGSVFYDASRGTRNRYITTSTYVPTSEIFSSAGGELVADFNILRIPFDISAGVRGIYIPSEQRGVLEAVFGVDVYGFSLGRGRKERLPWL